MLKLIKSLARNICRIASINTLANDMEINEDVTISKPAAIDYINGLKKLYFLIEIPCFH
jgi:predicted AAA+ superfamily ATPase